MPYTVSDYVPIHYEVAGEGPPLLLLHGAGSKGQDWQRDGYVERLSVHFTVVTVDQRGHGKSGQPDRADAYSPARRMSDAVAVMDTLEVPEAHIFGYSLGGWNAMRVAVAHPERVKSLVLGGCNPYPMSVNGPLVAPMRKLGVARLKRLLRDNFFGKVRRRLFPGKTRLLVSQSVRATTTPIDIDLAIERMQMPVLFFIGEFDQSFDLGLTREFAERLHDARFEMIPGEDHGVNRRSDKVLSLVEPFLLEQIDTSSG